MDGLVGAAAGGLGAGASALLGNSARLAATNPFVRELAINGAESVVSGGVERGLTGGSVFNPRALATDLLTGGVVHAPAGRVGPDDVTNDLVDVYRFHNAADPQTLRSRLSAEPAARQDLYHWALANDPDLFAEMIEDHANGFTTHSPFVSVTTDPAAAAATTDPGLHTIINGFPGPADHRAPDLSHFQVPRSRLHQPEFPLSHREGELLFYGDDLADHLVGTVPNPFP
ncbi:hypothetical protein [Actinoplanes siamensis]|uniref:hypothetical protein n=1 Tax=Actinoplanes siamensis TaxID=1223317 RepID=UPI0019433840|nr:hypothetical protein [Actinoplanes siamensis]